MKSAARSEGKGFRIKTYSISDAATVPATVPSKPKTVGRKVPPKVEVEGGVSCQQPDLVKFTVSGTTQHDEIDRWEDEGYVLQ